MRLPKWWKPAAVVGGVVVVALLLRRRMVNIADYFWQGAHPWGPMSLGFGRETIADAGCMLTALTMAANALTGSDWDPGDANDIVKAGNAFSGSLLELPAAADELGLRAPDSERIHSRSGAAVGELAARISAALRKGGVAIVNVDHSYDGSGAHFVLVHGENAGGFVAADPAGDGNVNPFDITIDKATLTASSTWNHHPVVVGVAPVYKA